MKNLSIILTSEPYGSINAAEAVRHALGAVGDEIEVSFVLTDGGVLLAARNQDEAGTEFTNLGGALKDCVDMGVRVYADSDSLKRACLAGDEIIDGVEAIAGARIAELVRASAHTMIY